MYPPNQGGMRTPDWGSTTGAASWTDDEPARRLPEGRAQRVNPPLTAIFKLRACTEVRAFCLYVSPKLRGNENTRPGFDTKTPGAFLNRACSGPEGARPRDGLSSGAASWTDRAHSERAAPKGRAKRVNPPLTAIFKKELVRKYGLFFALNPIDYRMITQFTSALSAYREHNAIRLTISLRKKTGR